MDTSQHHDRHRSPAGRTAVPGIWRVLAANDCLNYAVNSSTAPADGLRWYTPSSWLTFCLRIPGINELGSKQLSACKTEHGRPRNSNREFYAPGQCNIKLSARSNDRAERSGVNAGQSLAARDNGAGGPSVDAASRPRSRATVHGRAIISARKATGARRRGRAPRTSLCGATTPGGDAFRRTAGSRPHDCTAIITRGCTPLCFANDYYQNLRPAAAAAHGTTCNGAELS
ncbi:hypothetical protein EVAR_103080_1 [Eumeta japonica]|uniref:Uncharacterized protein n=1 Tax=Eumeta variegata TaxID=151549 RepID=A0A4C1WR99_EUMVA|nr:hypothetical protein EVAR_103080_1 [Eumeta japonica]